MKWFVYSLAVIVLVLHQDFWNFNRAEPLVFGFLPVGLAYHAGYSVACAGLMFLLDKFAWPSHLEEYENLPSQPGHGEGH